MVAMLGSGKGFAFALGFRHPASGRGQSRRLRSEEPRRGRARSARAVAAGALGAGGMDSEPALSQRSSGLSVRVHGGPIQQGLGSSSGTAPPHLGTGPHLGPDRCVLGGPGIHISPGAPGDRRWNQGVRRTKTSITCIVAECMGQKGEVQMIQSFLWCLAGSSLICTSSCVFPAEGLII